MLNTQSGKPVIAGLIITMIALAGCSNGSSVSTSSGAMGAIDRTAPHAAARPAARAANGQAGGAQAAGQAGKSATTARLAPGAAKLIYTAQFTVRAKKIDPAIGTATATVLAADGYVSDENANDTSATVELKIPATVYQVTLAQLTDGRLGTRVSLRQQAQDVTQQVADVSSQVTSDQAAISQLRELLTHAGSVADLLDVQNQINTEESALEDMQAQQKALDGETAFATVTVTVLGPQPTVKPATTRPPGLVSGIVAGWHAFKTSLTWLLAILGAVAPFAVVIAIAGYAAYRARNWFLRRFRPRVSR